MELYVSASETEIIYCAFIRITETLIENARLDNPLVRVLSGHMEQLSTHYLHTLVPFRLVINNHFGIWDYVNIYVLEHGPLRSIKPFRIGLKTFTRKLNTG